MPRTQARFLVMPPRTLLSLEHLGGLVPAIQERPDADTVSRESLEQGRYGLGEKGKGAAYIVDRWEPSLLIFVAR